MNHASDQSFIVNTTAASFESDVAQRSATVPVVVDFWAPWCAPCRALGPVLEKLAQEYSGKFILVKANTDELPEVAAKFNVQGIPAVYAVVNGEMVDFFSGAIPEAMLRQWIDRLLAGAAIRMAKRLEASSAADAEAAYRRILAEDARNIDAQIGLARTLFAQERLDESRAIVAELDKGGYAEPDLQKLKASLDLRKMQGADLGKVRAAAQANPNDLSLQYQLAEALAGSQAYDESLAILLSLVERDRKGTGEKARQLMVEIFQALPEDSELTAQYRRKLSMALY
jgi:putative thioredoxin